MRVLPLAFALGLAAAAAAAQDGPIETPLGTARVEGEAFSDDGLRLMVGDRELLRSTEDMYLWPEATAGDLLLVGRGSGGTACAALWQWVDVRTGAATEPFGTCADTVAVTHDAETVTVSMPSYDADAPTMDYVYDGHRLREVPRGQQPSGSPPEAGAEAWIGRYPFDLFRSSDWRGPLVALMGEEGYAEAQAAIGSASAMAADGKWVAGGGCMVGACGIARGAVAIHRGDGRLLVAVNGSEGPPRLWGEPRGPLPAEIAAVMEQPD